MAARRLLLAAALLAAGSAAFFLLGRRAAPVPAPAAAASAAGAADRSAPRVEQDAAAVFQRAFWRRPDASVRILHAERRDWSDGTAVARWQWFVGVDAAPEFVRWLLEENPFGLVRAAAAPAAPDGAPPWYPSGLDAAFETYRNAEGRFVVFLDRRRGRLFATDSGAGFAAAQR